MTKESAKFFKQILPHYFQHVTTNPGTMITRFHGFHAIRLKTATKKNASRKLYFVVMGNVFHTPVILHRRYDLKGSWVGRTVVGPGKSLKDLDPSIAMKDLDFKNIKEVIKLGPIVRAAFIQALQLDTDFLASQEILDYSLLFGIHVKSLQQPSDLPRDLPVACVSSQLTDKESIWPVQFGLEGSKSLYPWLDPNGMNSTDGKALYFCGVIDVFTKWTTRKKVEHTVKATTTTKSQGISCVHPKLYAGQCVCKHRPRDTRGSALHADGGERH
eukprot:Gregarina_sp_Poly_1__11196@NODE_916_length_5724_cov_311_910553_g651_i0_p2_GENE_NODE_916_length_5724_cov_311_910553_g651_i0NODE_916_length_5724_cov_311_910553_g651_i0_p2_ORF_typecomplete_len272_score34_65PIP5K/PF01504_18/1_7e55PhnA/PF03831_14/1_7e03PhnA/PF03831_14/0_45PhnA/PF03831_14/1_1e04_NODE_916_length_5724_cov_311_910553_g651_i014972312